VTAPAGIPSDTAALAGADPITHGRVRVAGKFFQLGPHKWYLKGVSYGPFAPNSDGEFLPDRPQLLADFRHLHTLGANAVRLYHVPSRHVLDAALEAGLRVFVDVPWQKHRCVFDDWPSWEESYLSVRRTAKTLGNHPGVFAISVVNEIPNDIVRFYGARRVEKFVDELLDTAKQECPDCPVTFTSFPPTDFLRPRHADFCCFNVYLNNPVAFTNYLDRLQHVADASPLVLGEYGADARGEGTDAQARILDRHTREIFRRGLAGSFVFSYTDDWFTGGRAIEDWEFGITDRHRREKPAAAVLRAIWHQVPHLDDDPAPSVSVVVCSYNGAATLDECLASLVALDYPDYEVILVDDGSTDDTPAIAARFPRVRYIRQDNLGLSVARNVGARAATGEIVAYTDSDCVADVHWLQYLVRAMHDQKVDAIGGPNITPASDKWRAQCVAASPGNPGHVMFDDRQAEHVPGCNMAFRRSVLLDLGGFDPQFRQAGDDVDVCWRLMDAGFAIGYAPAAVVWHHRRQTVRAYLRQQKGYGRAEGMLRLKHPQRFNALGCARWHGVIYGEGAIGFAPREPHVYHGRHGSALFQILYPSRQHAPSTYCVLLEWHAVTFFFLLASIVTPSLAIVSVVMASLSLMAAVRAAVTAPLPPRAPWWSRPLVFGLNLAQPVVRAGNRYRYRLGRKRLPPLSDEQVAVQSDPKIISWRRADVYWSSRDGLGRLEFLEHLEPLTTSLRWPAEAAAEWATWDVRLDGDLWNDIEIRTVTEELGGPKRFTRVRCILRPTFGTLAVSVALVLEVLAAALARHRLGLVVGTGALVAFALLLLASRRRCFRSAARLVTAAGARAGLQLAAAGSNKVPADAPAPEPRQSEPCPEMAP
jgi:GT2 family glycosyltransferase